jgi:hypothetical protein
LNKISSIIFYNAFSIGANLLSLLLKFPVVLGKVTSAMSGTSSGSGLTFNFQF